MNNDKDISSQNIEAPEAHPQGGGKDTPPPPPPLNPENPPTPPGDPRVPIVRNDPTPSSPTVPDNT